MICLMLIWTLSRQQNPPAAVLQAEVEEAKAIHTALPISPRRSVELARRLFNARSAEEIALLIRPGELAPQEALGKLGDLLSNSGKPGEPQWTGAGQSVMAPTEIVCATFGDFDPRLVILTPDEGDRWEIDFDAFARHCEPPLEQFIAGTTQTGMVRIVAQRNNYFNGPFGDDTRWACYSLHGPNAEEPPIFGYCEVDSETYRAMHRLEVRGRTRVEDFRAAGGQTSGQWPANSPFRTTLRLRKPAGAERHQYQIDEVLSDDWLVVPGRTYQETVIEEKSGALEQAPAAFPQPE